MAEVELTTYLEQDLVFSRGENPAFRLEFTGVTAEVVAAWVLTAEIRRAPLLAAIAEWDVTVDETDVTFSLDEDITATLPAHSTYRVTIESGDTVRIPMGGRLVLRTDDDC